MKTLLSLLGLTLSFAISSRGQSTAVQSNHSQVVLTPTLAVSELKFCSTPVFARYKKDTLHTYCLLGNGFFKATHSKNSNQVITGWLARHPKAKVIPVVTYVPFTPEHPGCKQTYCWVVDNKDTLNTHLVRTGCFALGTMYRPDVGKEMDALEKEMYGEMTLHMGQDSYGNFIKQVVIAEKHAKKNRLGIWQHRKSKTV